MTSLDCNVYKLIDEYITKSDHNNNNNCNLNNNNCNNNNENNSSQLIDENNDFVGSLLLNCNIINTRTNMTTTTTTTTTINNNNDDLTSNLKPNRPYSYYIATNMHPFDLSSNTQQLEDAINNLKLKQQEEEQENKKKQNEQQQQQKIRQRKKSASLKTPEKKLNRLSVSLTDLPPVTSTTGGDKSSLTQTPTLTGKKGNKKSKTAYSSHSSIIHNSKKYTLNHPTDDSEQEQSSLNTPKKSKINKFLKRLFSFKSTKQQQQQQPQNSKQSSSQKDIHQASTFNNTDDEHHHQPSSEDEQSTSSSKFTRFFSFRSSNKQTNKQQNNLIVTDIHQTTAATTTTTNNNKKSNEQTPNKENYLPDLVMKNNETDTSFVSSTELSYTEIADKLKRILNDKVKSQSQSSKYINDVNNNNIPFIDDDDVSICNSYDALNTSSSNRSNTHLNHDTTATTTSKTTPLSTTSNTDTTASSTPLSSTSRTNQQQQQQRPFSFLNSSNVEYILKKYNFPDELEKYLDENSSTPLDSTTFNYYTGWYQIALIFELIYHAIKYTGSMNSNNAADKLKLVATNYINDKYGNWINSYGGGWKSVPDSLSPSVKSGEIYSID